MADGSGLLQNPVPPAVHGVRSARLLRVGPVDASVWRALLGIQEVVVGPGSAADEPERLSEVRAERSFWVLPRTVSWCRGRSKSRTRMPASSARRTPQSRSTSNASRSRGVRAQSSRTSSTSAGRSGAVFRGARGRRIFEAGEKGTWPSSSAQTQNARMTDVTFCASVLAASPTCRSPRGDLRRDFERLPVGEEEAHASEDRLVVVDRRLESRRTRCGTSAGTDRRAGRATSSGRTCPSPPRG